jgi:hypothetical protein
VHPFVASIHRRNREGRFAQKASVGNDSRHEETSPIC